MPCWARDRVNQSRHANASVKIPYLRPRTARSLGLTPKGPALRRVHLSISTDSIRRGPALAWDGAAACRGAPPRTVSPERYAWDCALPVAMWTVKRLMIQFRLCIALLVLFCGSSLPAAAANPGDGDEALRAAALKLQLKTRAMEERLLGSPAEVLSVYVGVLPGQMSAVSATATVDGQPLASHDFMPIEAQALAGDALYRLGRVRLDPGPHHIDVEIVARSTADAAAAPRRFAAQLDYNKTPGAAALEVVPDGAVWPWSPRMLIVPLQVRAAPQSTAAKLLSTIKAVGPAADGRYLPGGADDPVLRYAEFLTAARQYLEAAVQLSLLQDRVESGSLDPAYEVAWSEALTRYGLLAQAGAPLLQATAGGADPHSVQTARHDLAEAFYGRGDWSAAWDTLGGETPPSKASERGPWRDLACRILLAQGRLNEAAGLLRDADTAADFDAYVRYYNLGVALVASGDVGQGLTVLERVGSVLSNDPQMTALSDRARGPRQSPSSSRCIRKDLIQALACSISAGPGWRRRARCRRK